MLLGLVAPTAGTATIDGRPYASCADPARTVGAVLEATRLPPGPLRPGTTCGSWPPRPRLDPRRVDEVLEQVGLAAAAAAGSEASPSGCASASGWPPPCSATRRS